MNGRIVATVRRRILNLNLVSCPSLANDVLMSSSEPVLIVVRDLLFSTKIKQTADSLGIAGEGRTRSGQARRTLRASGDRRPESGRRRRGGRRLATAHRPADGRVRLACRHAGDRSSEAGGHRNDSPAQSLRHRLAAIADRVGPAHRARDTGNGLHPSNQFLIFKERPNGRHHQPHYRTARRRSRLAAHLQGEGVQQEPAAPARAGLCRPGSSPIGSHRSPCCGISNRILSHGRLAGTGYCLDPAGRPGHRALRRRELRAESRSTSTRRTSSSSPIEGGCNAVASTLGVLGSVCARKYAHKIPFIVKLNHNELLTYPNKFDQIMFGSVKQAFDMGAVAVGRDDLFRLGRVGPADSGSEQAVRRRARAWAGHRPLVLPAQQRVQDARTRITIVAADLTGQANHLGVTIQADIIKQKLPENNGGSTPR